jgi:hypothetical protein
LPPGRAKFVTKPLLSGSTATANTIGIADVASLTAPAAVPDVAGRLDRLLGGVALLRSSSTPCNSRVVARAPWALGLSY